MSLPSGEREHLAALMRGARERGDDWALMHWQAEFASREAYYATHARLVRERAERAANQEPTGGEG